MAVNKLCRHFWQIKQVIAVGCHLTKTDINRDNCICITQQRFDIAKHANPGISDKAGVMIIANIMKPESRHKRDVIGSGKCFKLACGGFCPATAAI